MKPNPRIKSLLAAFLACKPEDIVSYTPEPKLLLNKCGTCAYYNYGICAHPNDLVAYPVEADSHSCGDYEPTKTDHEP